MELQTDKQKRQKVPFYNEPRTMKIGYENTSENIKNHESYTIRLSAGR